jgi:glycosyltransferase involved in cell wall biosynthesis
MSSIEYMGCDKPINKVLPLVSVCIPTYQHVGYIAQCLDSVLAQETSFPIEILIGEDMSSDGTREICMVYADKFPDKLRLFLNDREDVTFIDGRPNGRTNFLNLYAEARGEYISICEGDDYWTDKSKLEKQVQILQRTPDCSLVFHNALIKNGNHEESFASDLIEGFYDIESVITKPWFVPTQSILFRKKLLEFGGWAKHVYNFDYVIQLMLATKHPFYYIDKTMSAYRVHGGGTSWGREIFYHPIKLVETLSVFNCISAFKYDHLVKKRLDSIRSEMLDDARDRILRSTILSMSVWEKALTLRFYFYVAGYFLRKMKKK